MFTPTVFLPEVNSNEKNVALDDSKVHHLKNVLRVKDFDSVNISNGVGELLPPPYTARPDDEGLF